MADAPLTLVGAPGADGQRDAAADFGLYGQRTQLAGLGPGPRREPVTAAA